MQSFSSFRWLLIDLLDGLIMSTGLVPILQVVAGTGVGAFTFANINAKVSIDNDIVSR